MKKLLKRLLLCGGDNCRQAGFTMVELLVVISIIGILAAAVLAALNPAEQLKKSRDTAVKTDTATLLSALERYQATFGCYPWAYTAGTGCGSTTLGATATVITGANFTGTGNLAQLLSQDELKTQFTSRASITGSKMYLSETNNQVSVCFTPESKTARAGGMGPIVNDLNSATGTCPATATGSHEATCNVCVPQ